MGKSKGRDYWDYDGEQRAYSAMDRRNARKRKGQKRDPEADVEVIQNPVYSPNGRR